MRCCDPPGPTATDRAVLARDGTKREPEFLVIQLTTDALFQCPYLHMEDVGWAAFTSVEVERLRQYLLKGGFLWVDDFWGERAWRRFQGELLRIVPNAVVVDLTPDHPMMSAMYRLSRLSSGWSMTSGPFEFRSSNRKTATDRCPAERF